MTKRKVLRIAILIIIITLLYTCWQSALFVQQQEPVRPMQETRQPEPIREEQPVNPTPEPQPARSGKIELPAAARKLPHAPVSETELSYSLKRENTAIPLTPAVTYNPGQGVSVQVDGRPEIIQIQRDNTYRADEYQVLWQKKY